MENKKLDFEIITDKHKDTPAIILAHGPSLNNYKHKLNTLKNNGFIFIGMNEWFNFYDQSPNYYVLASTVYRVDRLYTLMNKYNSTLVYADSVDMTDKNSVDKLLSCNYLPYDQRHFNSKTCNNLLNSEKKNMGGFDPTGKCCQHIINGRQTIQEYLQTITKSQNHYKTGDTTALHALSLAIILGCNPIYFIGIDLDYGLGYANNNGKLIEGDCKHVVGHLNLYYDRIIEDLDTIYKSARNRNQMIYNLNINSFYKNIPITSI